MKLWWPALISDMTTGGSFITSRAVPYHLRISLRIHHNEESTQCVTGSDFWDGWRRYGSPISQAASDLSYLSKPDTVRISQTDAECSHRCVPVCEIRPRLFLNGSSPFILPSVGRSCDLRCDARCLSSGCFNELQFITTVRAFRE